MAIYKSALDLVGKTPLLEVQNFEKENNLEATVLVKLEYLNPAGSVKDRIAKAMIEDAEKKGEQAENKGTLDSYDSAITDAAQKSQEAKKEQEQQKKQGDF